MAEKRKGQSFSSLSSLSKRTLLIHPRSTPYFPQINAKPWPYSTRLGIPSSLKRSLAKGTPCVYDALINLSRKCP